MPEHAGARHDRRTRLGLYVLIVLALVVVGLFVYAAVRPARTFTKAPQDAPVAASTGRERVAGDQARFAEGEARRD